MFSSLSDVRYPKLFRVRQHLEDRALSDIPGTVRKELDAISIGDMVSGGKKIAVTAGSRGISNIAVIVKSIVDYVKDHGGIPFVVPAMGSHGGATAEGQRMVLEQYGIDENSMQCPVRSSMEVVYLGEAANGAPVYFDKNAYESDGVIVCNRIKPHTDFSASNESGLVKMVAIGLGKERGCSSMHSHGLAKTIPLSCQVSLNRAPILCGVAIVENSVDETFMLRGVSKDTFIEQDAILLETAKKLVPHLPSDQLDMLVVKQIGKIYSGTGMDTKVIGRIRVRGVPEPETPDIKTIVALRLNEHSYGNALGIGLADITTKELVDQIDRQSMYSNLIATTYLERGKIPIYFDTERESVMAAFMTLGPIPAEDIKMAVIDNTLHLAEVIVSEAVLKKGVDELEILGEVKLAFDDKGKMCV